MSKRIFKKVWKIISNIVVGVFLAVCVFTVAVTLFSGQSSDGAADIFGYELRLIVSDSMAPCEETDVSDFEIKSIPLHSMVFVQTVPKDAEGAAKWYEALDEGDVLTFRYVYDRQETITHRIKHIEKNENGGYDIQLAGDNKNSKHGQLIQTIDTSTDPSASTDYVIGRVVGQSRALGFVTSLLKNPIGMILIVIVPCIIIILLEVIKIVSVLNADKKKRAEEDLKQKDSELEELRSRLAELEQQGQADTPDRPTDESDAPDESEDPS